MARVKSERVKPHVSVGTIGHVDQGMTMLAAVRASPAQRQVPRLQADGAAFLDGYRPQFHFRTKAVTGSRFAHRDGGRNVGTDLVADVIQ